MRQHLLRIFVSLVVGFIALLAQLIWRKASIEVSLYTLFATCVATFAFTLLLKIVSYLARIDKLEKVLGLISDEVRMIKDAPREVSGFMVGYSKRFFGDISSESGRVLIANYLMLLEESLEVATEMLFATSLLTPTTWLSDKMYLSYFKKQLKKKRRFPNMDMRRVFILDKKDFFEDDAVEKLAGMHWKAGIKIGYCNKNMLEEKDLRDLVMFEANKTRWVVEAGRIPKNISSDDKKTVVNTRIHYSEMALTQLIHHWKCEIDANTEYIGSIKVLRKKRS